MPGQDRSLGQGITVTNGRNGTDLALVLALSLPTPVPRTAPPVSQWQPHPWPSAQYIGSPARKRVNESPLQR